MDISTKHQWRLDWIFSLLFLFNFYSFIDIISFLFLAANSGISTNKISSKDFFPSFLHSSWSNLDSSRSPLHTPLHTPRRICFAN